MNVQKLRVTKSYSEVQKVLSQLAIKVEVMLWQSKEEERKLFRGFILKIDPEQIRLVIQLKDDLGDLKVNDDCYIKFLTSDGVSKCKIITTKENTLILELHQEMVLSERRKDWRANFNHDDLKTVLIECGDKKANCTVINASTNGLAIEFNELFSAQFSHGKKFKVLQLGNKALNIPIEGTIAHQFDQGFGITVKEPFPQDLFDQFIFVERAIPVEVKKFYSDLEFQATVKSNMKMVLNKLEKKPKLAAALKMLKIGRESTSYIKNHIELLSEITCSVGKTLG